MIGLLLCYVFTSLNRNVQGKIFIFNFNISRLLYKKKVVFMMIFRNYDSRSSMIILQIPPQIRAYPWTWKHQFIHKFPSRMVQVFHVNQVPRLSCVKSLHRCPNPQKPQPCICAWVNVTQNRSTEEFHSPIFTPFERHICRGPSPLFPINDERCNRQNGENTTDDTGNSTTAQATTASSSYRLVTTVAVVVATATAAAATLVIW